MGKFWKRMSGKFDRKREEVWEQTRERIAERLLSGSEAPAETPASGAPSNAGSLPEQGISGITSGAAVGSTPDGLTSSRALAEGYLQRAEDFRRVAAEWRREQRYADKVDRFEEQARILEDQALRIINKVKLSRNTIIAIDGDVLTLADGRTIRKPKGSPAWGYVVGDAPTGFVRPGLTTITVQPDAGTAALTREGVQALKNQIDSQIVDRIEQASTPVWTKQQQAYLNPDEVSGYAASIMAEGGAFPSAGRQSYQRDPKTGEIQRVGRNVTPGTDGVRYILAAPGVSAEYAVDSLERAGSLWGGVNSLVTESRALELWREWRKGDRLSLARGWHLNGADAWRGLQRLCTDAFKEMTRTDLQVWEGPPLAPVDLSLGPLARDIEPRRLCSVCGKPAFAHYYQNDNTDQYGQTGVWTCLQEKPAPAGLNKEQLYKQLYSRVTISGPAIKESKTAGSGAFAQAAREGAGFWGAIERTYNADFSATKKPEAPASRAPMTTLTRTKRSYDDDF